jgi:hypothetical protein
MRKLDEFIELLRNIYGFNIPEDEIDSKKLKIELLIKKNKEQLTLNNYYKYLIKSLKKEEPLLYYLISAKDPIKATPSRIKQKLIKLILLRDKYYEITSLEKEKIEELIKFLKSKFSEEYKQGYKVFIKSFNTYLKNFTKNDLNRDDGAKAIYHWFGLEYDKNNLQNDCYKLYDSLKFKYWYEWEKDNSYILEIINETGLNLPNIKLKQDKTVSYVKTSIIWKVLDENKKNKTTVEFNEDKFSKNHSISFFDIIYTEPESKKQFLPFLKYLRNNLFGKKNREQLLLDVWINQARKIEDSTTWKEFEKASYKEWLITNKKNDNKKNWAYFLKIKENVLRKIKQNPIAKSLADKNLHLVIQQEQAFAKEISLINALLESTLSKTQNKDISNKTVSQHKEIDTKKIMVLYTAHPLTTNLKSIFINRTTKKPSSTMVNNCNIKIGISKSVNNIRRHYTPTFGDKIEFFIKAQGTEPNIKKLKELIKDKLKASGFCLVKGTRDWFCLCNEEDSSILDKFSQKTITENVNKIDDIINSAIDEMNGDNSNIVKKNMSLDDYFSDKAKEELRKLLDEAAGIGDLIL